MSKVSRVLNINVGILGHVDSGKTSLVAALSTHLSTAALDKHPQSKERGITLDLGFSSFSAGPLPPHLSHLPYDELQFTLVDCPGHASLIRTIIGGVHIIDMIVLVIDVTKGLQAQTAECLVVGEVTTPHMLIALNKVDMLPSESRSKSIRKAAKALLQTLRYTKFSAAPMVPVAAKPGSSKSSNGYASSTEVPGTLASASAALGIEDLKSQLVAMVPPVPRNVEGPFLLSVDHCFAIKGQGTVMTGTVMRGSVAVGDIVELPALKIQRPVRSMQAFKRPVTKAVQGDRVGVCVTQLDPGLMERGLAATPGSVPTFLAAVASVEKIRFYAGPVMSGSKLHISVGHETVMATVSFFGMKPGEGIPGHLAVQALMDSMEQLAVGGRPPPLQLQKEYLHQEELHGLEGRPTSSTNANKGYGQFSAPDSEVAEGRHHGPQWALLRFDHAVTAPQESLLIGARLDADIHGESCRLCFYGRLLWLLDPSSMNELSKLKVYKVKERQGSIERMQPDGITAICKGLFKKETDISVFAGLKVHTTSGQEGVIEGSFGKSGKFKVTFGSGFTLESGSEEKHIFLRFKRFINDPDRKTKPRQ
ncbi:hypothetical protein CEUSTIGMA_g1495.t1 [Chlamydomonas eustigma]|uniref:Tr-type G domain-containing protein n=1 Tax=Chlamydomonas eustigma TaxID=1157962 RepID=A0A250WTA9_9CHLO|nr:hypothetical protein CEUSTIGMA_g1495.t1 [Chlamydomonas eustigma]|eukprot:GAX74045.1 hypothetical protein CEUSTIGMA_g1495.t1 [Chlamydomonas eustigma]